MHTLISLSRDVAGVKHNRPQLSSNMRSTDVRWTSDGDRMDVRPDGGDRQVRRPHGGDREDGKRGGGRGGGGAAARRARRAVGSRCRHRERKTEKRSLRESARSRSRTSCSAGRTATWLRRRPTCPSSTSSCRRSSRTAPRPRRSRCCRSSRWRGSRPTPSRTTPSALRTRGWGTRARRSRRPDATAFTCHRRESCASRRFSRASSVEKAFESTRGHRSGAGLPDRGRA